MTRSRRAYLAARAQARAARRLASRAALISTWWDGLPAPRPTYLTPLALSAALGQSTQSLAAALRWLGWRRIIRRVHGAQVPLWVPPGSTLTPRPPGRPRLYAPY